MAEVKKKLGSSSDGFSQTEAAKRLSQYGANSAGGEGTESSPQNTVVFLGPIPWMIEVAVVLSGVVRHWPAFLIIPLVLVSNAAAGFFEGRQGVEALKARLAIKARVKRDGKWATAPPQELVPSGVIRLRLGGIVPANANLLDSGEVSSDQSTLADASLPAWRKCSAAGLGLVAPLGWDLGNLLAIPTIPCLMRVINAKPPSVGRTRTMSSDLADLASMVFAASPRRLTGVPGLSADIGMLTVALSLEAEK